ncbi:hypothetical protein FG93_01119 [Bosea sp. LC85]|uniref:hypothetical protein n=1 Tax=Bosea sp. LC85 TaxID=1502851 RepID=UPI0004E407A4|nr:hypothetical protein [Bosea sp. LC85]KFC74533.1 hypothetical protein FG93_01119 [Bosea sp. LC85]
MTKFQKRKASAKRFAGSFVAGLSTLAAIWPSSAPARYPHRSETDALRSDARKIGNDLRRVISREQERVTKK